MSSPGVQSDKWMLLCVSMWREVLSTIKYIQFSNSFLRTYCKTKYTLYIILAGALRVNLVLSVEELPCYQEPLLLTCIKFYPSMDKGLHNQYNPGRNNLSTPKLQRLYCCSSVMDELFHLHFIVGNNILAMLGLKLISVSEMSIRRLDYSYTRWFDFLSVLIL